MVVVVDLPLLLVAVEGVRQPNFSREALPGVSSTILSGDIQRSSMLVEVYRCEVVSVGVLVVR